ncbi:hypothetical protein KTE44_11680 [Burkholderia multivorans]|nr:hypothetical protein [Burkholderia multivorans]
MHADRLAKSSVPSSDRGMQYRAAADVFSSGAAFRSLPTDGLVDVSTDGEAAANASTEKRYEGAFFFCAADALVMRRSPLLCTALHCAEPNDTAPVAGRFAV